VIIQSVHIYPFEVRLKRPFFVRGDEKIDKREGAVVQLVSDTGCVGFGEAAPLPGASSETLRKALHQLHTLSADLKGRRISSDAPSLLEWLAAFLGDGAVSTSARFALESAVLDMAARSKQVPLCEFIAPGIARDQSISALLQGSLEEVVEQASDLKSRGYAVFKLKIGSPNIALDVRKVEEVKRRIGPGGMIRLDANGLWRLDEAVLFAQNIGKNQIDYIEEPCALPREWEKFHQLTDFSLGVDESISGSSYDELSLIRGVDCFVLRPMVRGALTGSLEFLRRARRDGRRVVISSAFETSLGLVTLANLALFSGQVPGLGTWEWNAGDIFTRPFASMAGEVPRSRLQFEAADFIPDIFCRLQAA
jgi:O-succinylbenzoate synthase